MANKLFLCKHFCIIAVILFMACALVITAQEKVTPVHVTSKLLTGYVTSWIGNDGGIQKTHVPHDMLNMYVRYDGVCVTVTNWDEGGSNVAVFKDGKIVAVPEGSGTGGWGRNSRLSATIDNDYVYHLQIQHGCDGANKNLNINGLPQFPVCDNSIEWKTVRRYVWNTGLSAPFSEGYGYKGDMLLVCSQKTRDLVGLGMTSSELFVAVTKGENSLGFGDSIKVYNKSAMSLRPVRQFAVEGGIGCLYADQKGGLWMLQGNSIIRLSQQNGARLGQAIDLPAGVNASSFCVDSDNERILVANYGEDLNILVYKNIFTKPEADGAFGQTRGIYSKTADYKQGQAGALRFMGPRGVGVDVHGNIYVANQAVSGGRGALLEAYNEKTKKQLWKTEGLIFTATADFDLSKNNVFYTPEKIHQIDYSKSGQRLDEFVAITADPFKYPHDQRCIEKGPFITSVFKRHINNQHILFVSDMYGSMIAGYRFNDETDGYIGIPFMRIWASNQTVTIWVDKNGDGQETPDEYTTNDNPNQYSMSFYPDQKGNIWRGTREKGFSIWKIGANNAHGVPQYEPVIQCALPGGTNGVKRIFYDNEKDELFLVGFSSEIPDRNKDGSGNDTWWCMGSTIAKYKNALTRINQGSNTGNWMADLVVYLPFGTEKDGSGTTNAKAFTVEGDYIFCSIAREGYISLYDRETGEYQGYISPGAEVGNASGWADFNYTLNARKNKDGSYEILNEENGFAKVVHYRWQSY